MSIEPSCHLDIIFNQNKSHAVILRRGPSKLVLAIRWSLSTDSFETGQWLKGRIYSERCSLSPNGEYFAYFAATHRPGSLGSWTAVSRPPYLTAIGLWWCGGGTYFQGGTFLDNDTIVIWPPYRGSPPKTQDGFELPRKFRVLGTEEFRTEYPNHESMRFSQTKRGHYESLTLARHGVSAPSQPS